MIEIKPGSELDFAVAKATGMDVISDGIDDDEVRVADNYYGSYLFRPSVDLNKAFEAAEKATGDSGRWGIQRVGIKWLVDFSLVDPGSIVLGKGIFAEHNFPALAICAAILKLFEEKEVSMTD